MRLIIGGYAQGKLDYALAKTNAGKNDVWDGVPIKEQWGKERTMGQERLVIINRFHLWVRRRLSEGGCPEEEIMDFLDSCGNCIIISDEIGNGIVPVEAFEREYRERTGRLLIRLAERAEEVERVICGMGQKMK